MATLDSKKNGRFIKKGDPLVKVLSISDFDLAEICQTPFTYHDNASANIIHQKLHTEDDLEETVRSSHEIEQVFTVPEERMIIQPLDFTEEWARLKSRQSNRSLKSDEDEEFDLESARQVREAEEAEKAEAAATAATNIHNPDEFAPGGLMDLPSSVTPAAEAETKAAPSPIPAQAPEETQEDAEDEVLMAKEEPAAEPVDENGFMPYASSPHRNAPAAPLERYPTEEELEAIREAARQEGFRQGFQSGEERATLEARGKVQAIMEEVANIVHNLEGMQRSILNNAQENFQAISQNLIEAMLHREFQLRPEAFGAIIERAISEGLAEDEFKIFVSPRIAKELKAWSNQDLAARIKADDTLSEYDFRVEGQNASIDASMKQIIHDLLEQADLSLFDSQEKVG